MVINSIKNCTSCGLCVISCPKQCLKIELNKNGFYRPVLKDSVSCVDCNLCDACCPVNTNTKEIKPLMSVSASANDTQILLSTSSGGICYLLANNAIINGSKVCACVYDYDKHRAEHVVIDNLEDLEGTKGSKYFQSYTIDAFKKVFDGGEYMVFGTPCQISAIDSYAIKKGVREKLTLVDFFCHGTPSINLWKKYIAERGSDKIRKIDFRSKEFGWHNFSLRFTYDNGDTKSDYNKNMFYNLFFSNLALNDSCYECKYKALYSKADIRVGDYWGEKFKDDKKGVSACLAFTEKGRQRLNDVLTICNWQDADISDLLKAQMTKSPALLKERKKVLKALRSNKSLKTIHNVTLFPYRLRCKFKSIIKRA